MCVENESLEDCLVKGVSDDSLQFSCRAPFSVHPELIKSPLIHPFGARCVLQHAYINRSQGLLAATALKLHDC